MNAVTSIPLVAQGQFAAGGAIVRHPGIFDPMNPREPAGQSFHGDHLQAFYQVPEGARSLPIVMLHGSGQSSRCWGTTADGREGYQTEFLRRGFATWVVDQPRRGQAARATVEATVAPTPDEQYWFNQFRFGLWPDRFPGVQFPDGEAAFEQFCRAMTPNIGELDAEVTVSAMSALFDKVGPAILFTHSRGGGYGWMTAARNANVKAIVAFEPGSSFIFPEDEMPEPIPNALDVLKGEPAPADQFAALTKIPILLFYGDNIPLEPVDLPAQDSWRARLQMARIWCDVINRRGGDAQVVHLPEEGVTGNTHFLFSDLNSLAIADRISAFLAAKRLDR